MPFLKSLRLDNFLSFPPGSETVELTPLNVLIGPNGSGKSNFIEALELLHATPTNGFAKTIRDGGSITEWLWKGTNSSPSATIEALIHPYQHGQGQPSIPYGLRYQLSFAASGFRAEITDEIIEEPKKRHITAKDVFFFYRFQSGNPVINIKGIDDQRRLERQSLTPDESVLSQKKDRDLYPELAWISGQFNHIQTFREWSFGRSSRLRQPQPADLPTDTLEPDSVNLALLLNHLEYTDYGRELNRYLALFLPRYDHLSTRVQGNTVQFYLHEQELRSSIPATRLSDGTIRFVAILALLLSPTPPPLLCIEEPELGLHPDALSLLAELMVEASSRTQLIVTTHSDALVSAFSEQADSVLICEHIGGTVLRRVESEKLKSWLDRYRLGEIWRIGELGGNP